MRHRRGCCLPRPRAAVLLLGALYVNSAREHRLRTGPSTGSCDATWPRTGNTERVRWASHLSSSLWEPEYRFSGKLYVYDIMARPASWTDLVLHPVHLDDRAAGDDLLVTPPTATRPHGALATRAPRRPNPIGLTLVSWLRREGPRLHVRRIDMLDGSPILDLKPYRSSVPAEPLKRAWLADAESRR